MSRGRGRSISRSAMIRPGRALIAEDPVGQEHRFAQIMSDENHGEALGGVQVPDDAPEFLAREGVERTEGLVEHQSFGSWISARQSEARCCMPPESCQGNFEPCPASPTWASSASARAS